MDTPQPTAGTNTNDTGSPAPVAPPAEPAGTDTLLTPPVADGQQPPADPKAPPEGGKPPGAPEQYADFTTPEGLALNADAVKDFAAFAKEKNLSQEDAQKFVDMGIKAVQAERTAVTEQIAKVQKEWAEASQVDKEFGGDKLQENLAVAKKALDTFGTPELSKVLRESGMGNHPEVIRAFYRIGQKISGDTFVPGGAKPQGGDILKTMYPTMGK